MAIYRGKSEAAQKFIMWTMVDDWQNQSLLDRMVTAAERVRDRLRRATAALEAAGVPYAVVGGNAVAAWVATVEPAAVRNTNRIEILIRRADLKSATQTLEQHAFHRDPSTAAPRFVDAESSLSRSSIEFIFACEALKRSCAFLTPDVEPCERLNSMPVLPLMSQVDLCLRSHLLDDRVDLRDMIDVGLIDQGWTKRFPTELAERLQLLIDTPDG